MGGKGKKNKGGRGKAHGGQQKGGRKGQTNGEQSEPAIVVKGKPGRLLPVPVCSQYKYVLIKSYCRHDKYIVLCPWLIIKACTSIAGLLFCFDGTIPASLLLSVLEGQFSIETMQRFCFTLP